MSRVPVLGSVVCMIAAISLLSAGHAYAQTEPNLIANPDFESSLHSWNFGQGSGLVRRTAQRSLGGNWSLVIDNRTSIEPISAYHRIRETVQRGLYLYSANVQSSLGVGAIRLRVRFNNDASTDFEKTFEIDGHKDWQKLVLPVNVPDGVETMGVYILALETSHLTFVDQVQLIQVRNLLVNGDFRNNNYWNKTGSLVAYSSQDAYVGTRSLKITTGSAQQLPPPSPSQSASSETHLDEVGTTTESAERTVQQVPESNFAFVTQTVTSGISSEALYTVAAHIRTVDLVTSTTGGGASVEVRCFENNRIIRVFRTPFLAGDSDEFVERSTLFLVPEITNRIDVRVQVWGAAGTAYFDNVRLTRHDMPAGKTVHEVGHLDVVEAPEPGTCVSVNDFASFQKAVDAVATGGSDEGKTLWVPRGTYTLENLIVSSGVHLKMHRKARLIRSVDGLGDGGFHSAFIRTPDNDNPQSNVIIEGGRIDYNGKKGRVIDWRGNRWVIRNMNIPAWSTPGNIARAVSWFGNDAYIYGNTITGPGGPAGGGQEGFAAIVMSGGTSAHITGNNLTGGDDAVGLFTTTVPFAKTGPTQVAIPSFNQDIRNVEIYNNVMNSTGGRAFACGLAVPRDDSITLTAVVQNVRVRNAIGVCGGRNQLVAVSCVPRSGDVVFRSGAPVPAQVSNISVSNMKLRGDFSRPRDVRPPGALWYQMYKQWGIYVYTAGSGSVRNVSFDDISISNFVNAGIKIRKDGNVPNQGIRVTNCRIDSRFSSSICDTHSSACRNASGFVFHVEARRPTEINNIESGGNGFIGPGRRCWDVNGDGIASPSESLVNAGGN